MTVGRLSDMWGRARMYNLGFAIFSTGSLLLFIEPWSGTTGAWALVIFRLIQAVGASFLFANSAALLTDAFPANERGKAMGINQVAFIGGSMVGLISGGILAGIPDLHLGPYVLPTWRLIFLVSVPIGIIGTVWAYAEAPGDLGPSREPEDRLPGQRQLRARPHAPSGRPHLRPPSVRGPARWAGRTRGSGPRSSEEPLLLLFVYIETKVTDPMFRI